MDTAGFKVTSAGHTGITVRSLPDALKFFHDLLGFPIIYQLYGLAMTAEKNVVGVPGAVLNTALLGISGGHQVELLEYTAPDDKTVLRPRPCDVGNVHLALNVSGSRALVEAAASLGWKAQSAGPVELRRGDGSLWAMTYLRSEDGITVELMEELERAGSKAQ